MPTLIDRYLQRRISGLPHADSLALGGPAAMRKLLQTRTLILTSSTPFYRSRPRLAQYFAVQDQTLSTKQAVLSIAGSLGAKNSANRFRAVTAAAHEAQLVVRETDTDPLGEEGVIGKLERTWYVLGTEAAMNREVIDLGVSSRTVMQRLEQEGKDVLFLAQKQPKRLLGIFALEQGVTPRAVAAIRSMDESGIECVLATAQKVRVATALAAVVGIRRVHGELSSEERRDFYGSLHRDLPGVAFISTSESKRFLPPDCFSIGVDGVTGDITVRSLEELPHLIARSSIIMARARRLFFWCTLEGN